MKIKLLTIMILIIICVACNGQKITDEELLSFLNEYREAKSFEYATNENWRSPLDGDNWGTEEFDKKYWHKDLFTKGDNFKPIIYVIKNDFTFEGVEVDNEEYLVKEYGKNSIYWVKGYETIFAKIENGKIQELDNPFTQNGAYEISIDTGRPQIFMDGMWKAFYVLEKDVPLLLKRLQRTAAEY